MSFPPSFLDELRQRLSLSDLVGQRVKLLRAGREYKACCPFHAEKSASFTVNDAKGFFHCFGCGAHGDAIGFSMRMDNLSFPEAVEKLAGLAGLNVPQDAPQDRARQESEKSLFSLIEEATRFFEQQLRQPAGAEARAYLKNRSLKPETIANFRLGYAPSDNSLIGCLKEKGYSNAQLINVGLARQAEGEDRIYSFFRNRLIFPVGDRRGRMVAFGARLLSGEGPKYINSPDHPLFHKGDLLYGYSRARISAHTGPLLVAEGYMDVITLTEAGFTGAVAPLGTALTEQQIDSLWKLLPPPGSEPPAQPPILCFDGDTAGQRAAARAIERLLPKLSADRTVRIAFLPEKSDPDSLIRQQGAGAMRDVLLQALPLDEAIWREACSARNLNTPEDKAGLREALRRRLSLISDKTVRDLYREALAQKLQSLRQPLEKETSTAKQPTRFINRKTPQDSEALREKVLLAVMINYPSLFHEFGDALAHLGFVHYETLRHDLVEILATDMDMPPPTLQQKLLEQGHAAALGEILSEKTYMHAGFARAGRAEEMARLGWLEQSHLAQKKQVGMEIRRLQQDVVQDESGASYDRLLALQAEAAAIDDPLDEIQTQP